MSWGWGGEGIQKDIPRADELLGQLGVPLELVVGEQVRQQLRVALAQPDVGQAVLVRDDLIVDAAQAEDQGADDARAVLAGRAVDEHRGGRLGRGQVGEDGAEGRRGMVWGRAGVEEVEVEVGEALHILMR